MSTPIKNDTSPRAQKRQSLFVHLISIASEHPDGSKHPKELTSKIRSLCDQIDILSQ